MQERRESMNISFSPPDMTELEVQGAAEAIRSGWITTGPKTKEFERRIADFCHVNKAVCLNSQTASAEMALRLLGIGEQSGGSPLDEVIVPSYTYIGCMSCGREACTDRFTAGFTGDGL